ncbi:BatA domain-containing protein [Patiriisocius hiemis]|uniref:BatA and WFA domain-containing protein n=1 Tax=Patiriisocius hiemis TaxID=3075604 RepID=A0ABU2Y9R5_9FLAO|nr:BatA and WFA domain-containing protein [Constantimarinum sp. W242]MDT0554928.1 BatA and WFA domain-containing protein [Constantimarinum sp. W242]
MQFKHPELLYALFLLLIPIIIHLFQLRRFQKVDFTNVAFLKKVTLQTRKSSQLKKWLTLLTRLLLLACIIIAFAQPFSASKTALNTIKETVIYIDNSHSMQAKGNRGELLQTAIQDVYKNLSGDAKITWFTNNFERKDASVQEVKNELLSLTYSNSQRTIEDVLLKANQLFSDNEASDKQLLIISDFQNQTKFPAIPEGVTVNTIQLSPVTTSNINIDSVYITNKTITNTSLEVLVTTQDQTVQTIPVSLYNGRNLIAKTAADFSRNLQDKVRFDVENTDIFEGIIKIEDPKLLYDNSLYFSINTPTKIKVLSINQANANFLQRLFTSEEFDYSQQQYNSLDYSTIPNQNFIILNELEQIPASLTSALTAFSKNGGSIFVIPSNSSEISSYNKLLQSLGIGSFFQKIEQEKKITQIQFGHQLYKNVFEKEVVNFQYPKVNSFYPTASTSANALLFEDSKPFIINNANTFVSTAPINIDNSNFQSSPLIVPTVYNMAQLSLQLPELYYTIGKQNSYAVPVQLQQDEIVTLKDSITSFIPLQETKESQVIITTTNEPSKAGGYKIENKGTYLKDVSYNYNRAESNLQYGNPDNWEGVTNYASINEVFQSISDANSIQSFWKWFVIFALLFLGIEMLILKYFK